MQFLQSAIGRDCHSERAQARCSCPKVNKRTDLGNCNVLEPAWRAYPGRAQFLEWGLVIANPINANLMSVRLSLCFAPALALALALGRALARVVAHVVAVRVVRKDALGVVDLRDLQQSKTDWY
jgi:hypothetical protein